MLLLAGTASANPTGATVSGWANSNRSGEIGVYWDGGPLLRNVPAQLTHTAFQLNTNSCASCHMTHTAVGANLLIQATTQATCMACHNGTIGFLNVNAPAVLPLIGPTHNAGMGGSVAAGTFNLAVGRTPSMHDTSVGVTLSGAPGGNRTLRAESGGAWTGEFTCASCHAPHGSHSIRLLHFNPNRVALRAPGSVTSDVYTAGGRYTVSSAANLNVANFTTATHANQVTIANVTGTIYTYTLTGVPAAPWVAGYANRVGGAVSNWTRVYTTVYNPNDGTIRAGGALADPANATWTATEMGRMLTRHFTINFATGILTQTPAQRTAMITQLQAQGFPGATAETADLRIDVARGLQVRARANTTVLGADDLGRAARLVAGARQIDFLDPASYDAPAYNLFCAACHTDYLPTLTGSGQAIDAAAGVNTTGVGIYSRKFRHTINRTASAAVSPMPVRGGTAFSGANLTGTTTGSNQLMCLSCHFGHGADASMMLLADNTRVSANAGAVGTPTDPTQNDVSATLGGSSALKRYINQASCWHCHVRAASIVFQNTPHYWTAFPQGPTW
jgi:predicted CXXCH cytochrome family protein